MIRLRPLVAVLLSLLLLGAQEMVFAHMIGHIGSMSGSAGVAVATVGHGTDGHGEALKLTHVCATCVSASGLASAAPFGVPPRLTFDGVLAAPVAAATQPVVVAAARHYRARAPPDAL